MKTFDEIMAMPLPEKDPQKKQKWLSNEKKAVIFGITADVERQPDGYYKVPLTSIKEHVLRSETWVYRAIESLHRAGYIVDIRNNGTGVSKEYKLHEMFE